MHTKYKVHNLWQKMELLYCLLRECVAPNTAINGQIDIQVHRQSESQGEKQRGNLIVRERDCERDGNEQGGRCREVEAWKESKNWLNCNSTSYTLISVTNSCCYKIYILHYSCTYICTYGRCTIYSLHLFFIYSFYLVSFFH